MPRLIPVAGEKGFYRDPRSSAILFSDPDADAVHEKKKNAAKLQAQQISRLNRLQDEVADLRQNQEQLLSSVKQILELLSKNDKES